MPHIMLDLETLGTNPNAAVIEIGAVEFDPRSKTMGQEFLKKVNFEDACTLGKVDGSTVEWWLSQSAEATKVLLDGSRKSARHAATTFNRFVADVAQTRPIFIWGKGPSFDCVILRSFLRACGLKEPWFYWNERCVRTVLDLGRVLPEDLAFEGVQHNGLDDAKHQVRQLFLAYERLNLSPSAR